MPNLAAAILRHVNDASYRPAKPKVIANKLGLENEDVTRLKRSIKSLVKKGKLAYGPSHLVCPVAAAHPAAKVGRSPAREKHIVGTFRRADAGFGFVRPEGTTHAMGREADIFVPANATGDAANGDTVRLRLSGKQVSNSAHPHLHQPPRGPWAEREHIGNIAVVGPSRHGADDRPTTH